MKLVNILKVETETLRVLFIEESAKYAEKEYLRISERKEWGVREWCKVLGVEPTEKKYGAAISVGYPSGFYNTSAAKTLDNMERQVRRVTNISLSEYVESAKKDAQNHYENSIMKLANRLASKELNIDTLVCSTSHIGVNIETVLTDGNKSVRAFTILACGEINAPHYRYLIK